MKLFYFTLIIVLCNSVCAQPEPLKANILKANNAINSNNTCTTLNTKNSVMLQTSNLPIVRIQTEDDSEIVDEPKVLAEMFIIYKGLSKETSIDDTPNIYSGYVGIEIRGNFSADLPQKPYGFTTVNSFGELKNVSLLDMPEENDWILLANYNDKVMMRNTLSFDIFRKMGHYAPRAQHCEVVLNGSYEGVYLLTEKIKQDKGRVDIARLDTNLVDSSLITGGYIFKVDYYEGDSSWLGSYSPINLPGTEVHFVYHDPNGSEINEPQKGYIQNYVESFEDVLYSDDFDNLETGYRSFIDVHSFIDYFIVSEFSYNVDAYKKSKYYFKNSDYEGGRLHSGPVWDFDWAYKFATNGRGWRYIPHYSQYPTPSGWAYRMMQDTLFQHQLGNRYHSLRRSFLHIDSIYSFIDAQYELLNEAQARHYQRWPILGIEAGGPEPGDQPSTFEGVVDKFKSWIATRLDWLDENMPEEYELPEEFTIPPNVSASSGSASIGGIKVYPNPVSDFVFLESDNQITEISVYSSSGINVFQQKTLKTNTTLLNVQKYSPGLYVLIIVTEVNNRVIKKLLIQ